MDPLQTRYHRPSHRARYTDHYVFSQLIPYIGNKRKLLPLIGRGVRHTGLERGTFVDLFSGSTVVARWAKASGFAVLANDWEPYSFEIAGGTVVPNREPDFAALGGVEAVFETLNGLSPRKGYVTRHLCPADDENPDLDNERMFFTRDNGSRIDAVRGQIERWEQAGALATAERSYLLAALLYSTCYVSNTSGVFKAFHRGWGGKTGTALYRIKSRLQLAPPVLLDNGQKNLAMRQDAQALAPRLREVLGQQPDMVYVDPPYNQHPYGSNYHLLNTVALWDKPPLHPSTRVHGRTVDKAAIRKDWRTLRRSPYNHRSQALDAFVELLASVDARWVLVSYSTDGMIPIPAMMAALADRGRVELFTERYKRYRVSTPRPSPRPHTVEFVALVDTAGRGRPGAAEALTDRLLSPGTER